MSCWCGRQGFRACCWALCVRCECGCTTPTGYYTIFCMKKISVLRSWRWALVCPKHVELILEINKTVIVASSWFSIFTLPKLNSEFLWTYSIMNSIQTVEEILKIRITFYLCFHLTCLHETLIMRYNYVWILCTWLYQQDVKILENISEIHLCCNLHKDFHSTNFFTKFTLIEWDFIDISMLTEFYLNHSVNTEIIVENP
jgi:hypothetical protein